MGDHKAKISSVICDESSLTGESQEIEKSHDADCFLLSSCLIESGDQQYAVVISTGIFSQWGKIKSTLSMEAEPTPLQIRLERLTTSVGTVGVGVAVATFAILVVYASLESHRSNAETMGAYVNAFIMAVVIIVIAVPEGLPLAVTISLAYSASKVSCI